MPKAKNVLLLAGCCAMVGAVACRRGRASDEEQRLELATMSELNHVYFEMVRRGGEEGYALDPVLGVQDAIRSYAESARREPTGTYYVNTNRWMWLDGVMAEDVLMMKKVSYGRGGGSTMYLALRATGLPVVRLPGSVDPEAGHLVVVRP